MFIGVEKRSSWILEEEVTKVCCEICCHCRMSHCGASSLSRAEFVGCDGLIGLLLLFCQLQHEALLQAVMVVQPSFSYIYLQRMMPRDGALRGNKAPQRCPQCGEVMLKKPPSRAVRFYLKIK